MKNLALLALTASLLLAAVANPQKTVRAEQSSERAVNQSPQDQNAWEGAYEFTEDGGRAGGAAMLVTHTLVVRRRGGALPCELDASGFQTSVSLNCEARAEGGRLNIYFSGYREGNVFERYRRGQLLLTLERATVRGKPRLLTHWGAYEPALKSRPSGRVYFRKSG
jgi:hypothetical protein